MFVQLSNLELEFMIEKNLAIPISRWETIEKARAFYSKMDGKYTGNVEDKKNLLSAYSTPVRVYMIKKC